MVGIPQGGYLSHGGYTSGCVNSGIPQGGLTVVYLRVYNSGVCLLGYTSGCITVVYASPGVEGGITVVYAFLSVCTEV